MAEWSKTKFTGESRTRITELIKIVDFRKNKKFKTYRYFKNLQKHAVVYLPIYKDGKPVISQTSNKPVNIPFNVTNFDPATETFDDTKVCPFVKASMEICKYVDEKQAKSFKPQVNLIAQAIDRNLQDNPDKKGKPSKKERTTGFKESLESDSFTPVECHTINFSIGQNLESFKETNTVMIKDKKGNKKKHEKDVADHKYGRDVLIKYDDNAQGTAKYKVQVGERTPITEEEEAYLTWDVVSAIKETTLSPKEAKVEAERILAEFLKSVKKSKKKSEDDDDDDEDLPDDLEDDDDDEEEEKSSKKKTKASSKKKKKVEDDDDDDEDEDDPPFDIDSDDDEDEEEKSSKKKKSKVKDKKPVKKTSSKKKKVEEEDEDEEEDDDDDDDSDDELDLDEDDDDE